MNDDNTKPKGLFNSEQIEKIKKLKTGLQKGSVWFFIGGVILAALMIMTGDYNVMGRMMGTIFVIGFVLIFSASEFARINSEFKSAQVFSLMGIISNIAWALIVLISIWTGLELVNKNCDSSRLYAHCTETFTFLGRALIIASSFAGLGFFGCLTMGIKEYDKRQTLMPLKITAGICLTYTSLFSLLVALEIISENNKGIENFGILAGFASIIWFVSAIAAYVISKNASKDQVEKARIALVEKGKAALEEKEEVKEETKVKKSDDELRAEIEEKVRREMIEKEVREKIEKEMAEKAKN